VKKLVSTFTEINETVGKYSAFISIEVFNSSNAFRKCDVTFNIEQECFLYPPKCDPNLKQVYDDTTKSGAVYHYMLISRILQCLIDKSNYSDQNKSPF